MDALPLQSDSPARRLNIILLPLLIAVGAWLWFELHGREENVPTRYVVLLIQVAAVSIPRINRWFSQLLDRLRRPRHRTAIAVCIGLFGAIYLGWSAWQQDRDLFPKYHDESMHLIEARIMAGGHLWLPPHAWPQFFETFHVFVMPVYAGMQFPGTSMLYVPGFWLHLPYWVTPLSIAGISLALIYVAISELIDGAAGLLAALMLLGTYEFRYLSVMALSDSAALMLGLAIVCTWLWWRKRRTLGSAATLGLCIGWAAITRPPDALCFVIPVAIAFVLDLRKRHGTRPLGLVIAIVIGALPMLTIQLLFDRGVTGHWLRTPHEEYVRLFHPGLAYGLSGDAAIVRTPQTALQQKLDYYNSFVLPLSRSYNPSTALHSWWHDRLPDLPKATLPSVMALLLVPVGLLPTGKGKKWVIVSTLPLFFGFYALSRIYAPQYALVAAPAMIVAAISSAEAISRFVRTRTWSAEPLVMAFLFGLSFTAMPQMNPAVTEQSVEKTLSAVQRAVAGIPGRAVVFFLYRSPANVHEEPVYNIDSAKIDDARVVRAQDLGPLENIKLYNYYRRLNPDRTFYRFDRATRRLTQIDPKAEYDAAVAYSRRPGL